MSDFVKVAKVGDLVPGDRIFYDFEDEFVISWENSVMALMMMSFGSSNDSDFSK